PRFDVEWPLRACLSSGQWVRGRTTNISTTGMLFCVPIELQVKDTIELEIIVHHGQLVRCRLIVERQAASMNKSYCYGAALSEMTRDSCVRLARHLNALSDSPSHVASVR